MKWAVRISSTLEKSGKGCHEDSRARLWHHHHLNGTSVAACLLEGGEIGGSERRHLVDCRVQGSRGERTRRAPHMRGEETVDAMQGYPWFIRVPFY